MNYRKKTTKGNTDNTTTIINLLKSFKISILGIENLKIEIDTAAKHIKQIHDKFNSEIKLLELDKNKSLRKLWEYKEKGIEDALKKTQIPSENYYKYNTYTNIIFNRKKYKELELKRNSANLEFSEQKRLVEYKYEQERHKNIEMFDRRISDLNKQRANVKWWESSSYKLLQHTITRRGKEIALGSKLPMDNPDLIYKALDIYRGELEKKEQLEKLIAKAAVVDKKSRQLANSVKRKIIKQVEISNVCPYCGVVLNIDTAHADHIYPLSKGGLSTTKNMVYVCHRCNMLKTNLTLSNFIKSTGYNREDIEKRLDLLKKEY